MLAYGTFYYSAGQLHTLAYLTTTHWTGLRRFEPILHALRVELVTTVCSLENLITRFEPNQTNWTFVINVRYIKSARVVEKILVHLINPVVFTILQLIKVNERNTPNWKNLLRFEFAYDLIHQFLGFGQIMSRNPARWIFFVGAMTSTLFTGE